MNRRRALSDLPFAAKLTDPDEAPGPHSDYELTHFAGSELSDTHADGARFTECAFSNVGFGSSRWRRARFADVWLDGCQFVGTDLVASDWLDAEFVTCALAGTATFDLTMNRVEFHGCKLVSVNLRETTLKDVTFRDCVLRDVDFLGAELKRVAFPGSDLLDVNFDRAAMERVDIRGAGDIDIRTGGSLSGLTINSAQLAVLAPAFAAALQVTVED